MVFVFVGQDDEDRIKVNISRKVRPVQAYTTIFGYIRNGRAIF